MEQKMRSIALLVMPLLCTSAFADFFVCEAEKQVFIELSIFGVGMTVAGDQTGTYIVAGQQVKSNDDTNLFPNGCEASSDSDEIQCESQDGDEYESFWMSRFHGFTYRTQVRNSRSGDDMHSIVMGQCKKFSE